MRPSLLLVVLFAAFTQPAAAQIVFHDDAGMELVAEDARVDVLASELKFTEGPVWIGAQQRLVFSDIPASKLLQWTEADGVQDFLVSEQANGNALDAIGRLLSCQHGARNVVRREADGTLAVIANRFDEKLLNSPNDLAVRVDGTVWFTDPSYGLGKREAEQPLCGVYRVDPDSREVVLVQKDFDRPNGIGFAPDHRSVWIAVEPSPTNCAFGGADGRTLFVTARTKLLRIEVLVGAATMPAREPAAEPRKDGEKR